MKTLVLGSLFNKVAGLQAFRPPSGSPTTV